MNFFSKNLKFLRERAGMLQDDFEKIGIKKGTYSNYETGKTEPKIETMMVLSKFLGVSLQDLISVDLSSGNNYHDRDSLPISVLPDGGDNDNDHDAFRKVPIIDIESAAGSGAINGDYIEVLGYISVPNNMLSSRTAKYWSIRNRGESMSPTIFDSDILILRQLETSEWQDLQDEHVYVIVDREGKSYTKRIKERFHRGFLVLQSDNLDKITYPNFNLYNDELSYMFKLELKISAKFPNINSTVYSRVKDLEDRLERIEQKLI